MNDFEEAMETGENLLTAADAAAAALDQGRQDLSRVFLLDVVRHGNPVKHRDLFRRVVEARSDELEMASAARGLFAAAESDGVYPPSLLEVIRGVPEDPEGDARIGALIGAGNFLAKHDDRDLLTAVAEALDDANGVVADTAELSLIRALGYGWAGSARRELSRKDIRSAIAERLKQSEL
jgi:hypothetical protein